MSDNLYEVLGVAPDASIATIRAAYRRLAREAHPDAAGATTGAQVRMSELNEAWRVLGDRDRKRAYDHDHGFVVESRRDVDSPLLETAPQPSSPLSAVIALASAFGCILLALGFVGGAAGMMLIGVLMMLAAGLLWGYRVIGAMRTRPRA